MNYEKELFPVTVPFLQLTGLYSKGGGRPEVKKLSCDSLEKNKNLTLM